MIEIFSSIIGLTPSILDSEKNVSRTLDFPDVASPKIRDFFIFIIFQKLFKTINLSSIILILLIKIWVDFIICYLLNEFCLINSFHLLHLLDGNE